MASTQLPLALSLDTEATFDNYYVAPSQQLPVAVLKGVATGQGEKLVYLAGRSGRRHLLQACCQLADAQGRSVRYIPAAELLDYPAEMVLEDADLMRALVMANDRAMGSNIVDLRGLAMERLEARLTRLEDTHRNVIAAAYENLAGTNQVHRAILCMLDPIDFEGFLRNLGSEVAAILRVDTIRLVLETAQPDGAPASEKLGNVLHVAII